MITDLMKAIAAANIPPGHIDHHASDLYLKVTPETTEIINNYQYKDNVTKFIDNIDSELWYDIPFAYYKED